jgi:hypothetical protein
MQCNVYNNPPEHQCKPPQWHGTSKSQLNATECTGSINDIINKIIERDFCHHRKPCINNNTLKVLNELYKKMIKLKNVSCELFRDSVLIDTCYFFRGKIPMDKKIIITDGVILEILQGCIHGNKANSQFNYLNDLQKLLNIKNKMGDKCILIHLNNKFRQYYPKCRAIYSLRRNVDSELLQFVIKVHQSGNNIQLATFDRHLQERIDHKQVIHISEKIIYDGSYEESRVTPKTSTVTPILKYFNKSHNKKVISSDGWITV